MCLKIPRSPRRVGAHPGKGRSGRSLCPRDRPLSFGRPKTPHHTRVDPPRAVAAPLGVLGASRWGLLWVDSPFCPISGHTTESSERRKAHNDHPSLFSAQQRCCVRLRCLPVWLIDPTTQNPSSLNPFPNHPRTSTHRKGTGEPIPPESGPFLPRAAKASKQSSSLLRLLLRAAALGP